MAALHDARAGRGPVLLVGGLLVGVLAGLLGLQVGWLGELADAQGEQTRRVLQAGADNLVRELGATLAELERAVLEGGAEFDASGVPLVAEVARLEQGEQPQLEVPSFVAESAGGERWLIVLDVQWLQSELFPALARSALGPEGLETYRVAVVAQELGVAPLYRSRPRDVGETIAHGEPDASADLWLLPTRRRGYFTGGGNAWTGVTLGGVEFATPESPVFVSDSDGPRGLELVAPSAPWRLELRHEAGSLGLALAHAHARNLWLGGGLIALLVAGFAFLWVAEQRARRLAERELAFVAGISHELRTPLAVVRTAASNLERGVVSEPARVAEYGGLIEREVTRVSTLVERVLRFSGEGEPLVRDELEVEAWIGAALERCRPWRDRRRFEVAIDVARDATVVTADGAALTSLMHNLIENAIKYGAEGQTIRVSARRSMSGSGPAQLVVEVADAGAGVPAEDRSQLFEPFYRGASARAGRLPGNGLGLGVARDIARAHGGELELVPAPPGAPDSAGAPGAVFRLSLPLPEAGS